jgi:Domain of unknown function (DUF5668)/Putative adhesin
VNVNRGLVFWGVAFITAGGTALAIQAGLIPDELARDLWRYWPVVLIVIGIAVIAARTAFALLATLLAALVVGGFAGTFVAGVPEGFGFSCGGQTDNSVTADGAFGASATVQVELNCGELAVLSADGSEWAVDARYAGDTEPTVTSDDGSLRVASEGATFPFGSSQQNWTVTLPRDVALDLDVDTNAGSGTLDLTGAELTNFDADMNAGSIAIDLSGANVADLDVGANAGSVSLTADADASISGSLEVNAGSIELCVADGAAISITVETDNITFNHNLDESNLVRNGETWTSGDGAATIALAVEGNAASFTLNPEDGCS